MIKAQVIAKSISPGNVVITTFELEYPRFIHSQLMTHRVFSRNSSSSRAVPVAEMIKRVEEAETKPQVWKGNKKGMSPGGKLDEDGSSQASAAWDNAKKNAIHSAKQLNNIGVHKQWVNRLLEPFSLIRTIVTTTDLDNFIRLRVNEHAQDEIRTLALSMLDEYNSTDVNELYAGEWHLPYVLNTEKEFSVWVQQAISVARCARVSYLSYETGQFSDPDKDIALFHQLKDNGHWSPFEHVAMAISSKERVANFRGWVQLRQLLDNLSQENS